MGGVNKGTLSLGKDAVIDRVMQCLVPQTSEIILNVNDNSFSQLNNMRVQDHHQEKIGPLGGIHAALSWMKKEKPEQSQLLVVPCDCPFLPMDLAPRLASCAPTADIIYARTQERDHYVVSLWNLSVLDALESFILSGHRSVGHFFKSQRASACEFEVNQVDPFFNINTPEELKQALSYEKTLSTPK